MPHASASPLGRPSAATGVEAGGLQWLQSGPHRQSGYRLCLYYKGGGNNTRCEARVFLLETPTPHASASSCRARGGGWFYIWGFVTSVMASKSDEMAKIESLSSAAAFVEGGVQDACEDACSICLEAFCDSDPSTLTGCKHEFHLQCILEWCQRSSQCPMCWQPISLKDPSSQELLEAVEQERNIRSNQTQNTTIFHHPALGDFDLQHLPIVGNDAELEERILQHIAAAAAMGRAHHLTRREGHRGRSGSHGRPQFFVFSTHPNMPSAGSISSSSSQREGVVESSPVATGVSQLSPHTGPSEEPSNQSPRTITSADQDAVVTPRNDTPLSSPRFLNSRRSSAGQSTPVNNDRAGSSDLQSFSDSLKSRLNAVSMRYKESITKSTRGWKEKLFSRNTSVTDLGSEVRREVNAGIASVSRMMERFETRGNRSNGASTTSTTEVPLTAEVSNERVAGSNSSTDANTSNTSSPCVATSGSN